jgi:excisionase family DNA binding protein
MVLYTNLRHGPLVRLTRDGRTQKGVLVTHAHPPSTSSPDAAGSVARTPSVSPSVEPRLYRQLFDRESLADYLRLSTDTIDRLVKANKLQCVRIGQQVRFTLDDVEVFLERHRSAGQPRLSTAQANPPRLGSSARARPSPQAWRVSVSR